jgi:hypothetical protein
MPTRRISDASMRFEAASTTITLGNTSHCVLGHQVVIMGLHDDALVTYPGELPTDAYQSNKDLKCAISLLLTKSEHHDPSNPHSPSAQGADGR